MNLSWSKYTLHFKRPAGTSRGVMKSRDIWYLFDGNRIGECAPLPGLSLDDLSLIESKLDQVCASPQIFLDDLSLLNDFPSIRFGLEMLTRPTPSSIAPIEINGLIWMGDKQFMIQQIRQKKNKNWSCIKMKIGALDFETELEVLKTISQSNVVLRVDANGAFDESNVKEKLKALTPFNLHSIEQPIMPGQWDLLAELCDTSPIPIALDEELIPLQTYETRVEMLDMVKPQYLVLKPSLLGGFSESEKWIKLAEQRGIGWWITSALESNVGLEAIAGWASQLRLTGHQGLGTGQLFTNNIPSPLKITNGCLAQVESEIWNDVRSFISEWLSPTPTMELQTSGSTGNPKTIEVTKEQMRNSARLTGATFGLKAMDTALLCLPMQYVAAKMMVVRAMELELELKVITPSKYIEAVADFVAMTPMQLENSLGILDKAETIIVGGSRVSEALVAKLQNTTTEVYETYGMTETLTHVAIKPLNGSKKSEYFHALDGVSFETDRRNCLIIHAPNIIPKKIVTNDVVELINATNFKLLGRADNVINSGGIKVHPEVVEELLASAIPDTRYFIAGLPDKELGQKVVLIVEGNPINISFDHLPKYNRPKEIIYKTTFTETESGKINRLQTLSS